MVEETLGPTEMAAHQSPAQAKLLKYALFVLAGILLLAGVVIGYGYWWGTKISTFKTQMPKLPIPTQNLTPIETPATTPTPATDPTADWKTYTNTKYNYQISYPPNFTAVINKESLHGILLTNSDKTITIALEAPIGTLSGNASERLTPITNLKFIIAGVTYSPEEAFYFPSEKKYRFRIASLLKDGKSWGFDGIDIFSIYSQYTKPEDIKIIDQILSTFKFLD